MMVDTEADIGERAGVDETDAVARRPNWYEDRRSGRRLTFCEVREKTVHAIKTNPELG